eukprot:gene6217-6453_t
MASAADIDFRVWARLLVYEVVWWALTRFLGASSQCKIDDIASGLGLYKIKVLGSRGTSCMFAISPDMTPKQQAHIMFDAAKELRKVLAKVLLPDGASLASQITIHAGSYAGGVVGKGAWSYDLFGHDVQVLLDLDLVNSPNCIQVSDPALALLSQLMAEQFAPTCKVVCNGRELGLHQWVPQGLDGGPRPALAGEADPSLEPGSGFRQTSPMFGDGGGEDAFVRYQARQLSRMDMLFVVVSLLITGSFLWSISSAANCSLAGLLLKSAGQWLVPVVALAWYLWQPNSYCRWREPLWVVHRVLSSLNLIGSLLSCTLERQQLLLQPASSNAARLAMVDQRLEALLRKEALAMLADSVGFKVRFRVHVVTAVFNTAVAMFGVLWQWSTSSPNLALGELLLRLVIGCAVPLLLVHLWEREERRWFVEEAAGRLPGRGGRAAKAKTL